MKVKERNLPVPLRGCWLAALTERRARPRRVRPAISGHRFLPLAVPDNIVTKVQVRYYDGCSGAQLQKADLARLAERRVRRIQKLGRRRAVGASGAQAIRRSGTSRVDKPALTAYDPVDCGSLRYRPIEEEVRVASSPDVNLDS